ncbi:hypothetical protein P280DRAFT_442915 [Massarina eburnea CBS 473.64]|uniref:Uncharacterized protein n=1 Tax=Massarina eburnea CBS 473.64 TaxID=1395130 RepID=A0A6A6SDS3_9PLEO|nr:hypothetical protein P280DRAFT_442915 [Massarina eburnea CBS 473.64]
MPICSCFSCYASRSKKTIGAIALGPTPVTTEQVVSQRLAQFAPEKDRGHHSVQWSRAIERHIGQLKPRTAKALLDLCDNSDLESSLAQLTKEYTEHGLVATFNQLEGTLGAINSFSTALSSIAQVGDRPGNLLWGSTLLLITATLRHQDVLSSISQMLDQLTKLMPRFESYLDIYPTYELRRALRDIYDDFIEFCLSTTTFLNRHPVENFLRLSWSSTDKTFQKIKQQLQAHKEDFESEARLANVKATQKWQEDMKDKLSDTLVSRSSTAVQYVTTIPFPRNKIFSGREDIFLAISKALQLSAVDYQDDMRSVVLHGIGGVGKTQTALEYAYRYKSYYSHVFWIKAETEVELQQSLVTMVKVLHMDQGGVTDHKAAELAMRWLNATSDRWLLVFDNVQKRSSIVPYWPHSSTGNVIVTSQKPLNEGFATLQLKVNPFSPEEGSSLILSHMHLEESSRGQAEELSNELSGSPLAIAHYLGYATASHMGLTDILETFQRRGMTAEVWSNTSNASLMLYERTLSTVWDTALECLNPDSKELLHILAFLNPDRVPEELLRKSLGVFSVRHGLSEDFSLTVQISELIRRNLVERNVANSTAPSLRFHRALQLALLLKLDKDSEQRQKIFLKAYQIVRASFPHRDMTSRSPEYYPIWRENIPQVISLQTAYERSDPPIAHDLEFAGLLADAGSFLWEHQINRVARSVLSLGEKIALKILRDDEPSPTLASIETYLGLLDAHETAADRQKSIERLKLVVRLRENFLQSLPEGTATTEQKVDVGRAWNDLGYLYADFEEFQEADRWMTKSLDLYKSISDETTLRFRFSLQYIDITVVRFGQGRINEALELSSRACHLCTSELGQKHPETVRFESQWSYVLIGAGKLEEALQKLMDVLAVRSELLELDNPDVLNTNYWIGTIHYYRDQLDEALKYLRIAVKHGTNSGMGKVDLARAQYRLALVLYAQQRRKEAVSFEEDAIASVSSESRPATTDHDGWMTLLDKRVYIQNGRSTGPFRGIRVGKV